MLVKSFSLSLLHDPIDSDLGVRVASPVRPSVAVGIPPFHDGVIQKGESAVLLTFSVNLTKFFPLVSPFVLLCE